MIHRFLYYSLLCFSLISFGNVGFSQTTDYNHYSPLKCHGTPPIDFLKPSYEKYYSDVADIRNNKSFSKREKKLQKEFSFITNYKIDDILMSGKVLYGNKVSNYINAIADKLLVNEPALKGKMRFYLLNVPYANALSTNNGIVFVTTGLIAQLENEAQLAFVLSHEISHFKLNHSFASYKKTKDILVDDKYDDLGTDEKILKILKYSKENESEADVEGLKIFANAGYDKNESLKMMDILLYSYLPFDEIPFPQTFFNDSFYKVPKLYFPDSVTAISAMEDEDDEESSHPNTGFRKTNLEKYISSTDKGTLFLFSKEEFDEVVKLSRYELGYLLIVRGSYVKAFYQAFMLEEVYEKGQFSSELMLGALYGMNKYRLNADEDDEIETKQTNKEFEGQISMPYGLFKEMKKDEFNVLCAKTIYNIYQKYPTKYAYKVTCDVFTDLLYGHKMAVDNFIRDESTSPVEVTDGKEQTPEDADIEKIKVKDSKVKKIKRNRSVAKVDVNSGYERLAFITEFKSAPFTYFFDSMERYVLSLKKSEQNLGLSELRSEPKRRFLQFIKDERNIQDKKGKALAIDSLIVIAPSFSSIHFNHSETEAKSDNLGDELKSIDITEFMETIAKQQQVSINLIDINRRTTLTSDQLNQFSVISTWIGEKYSHIDKNDLLFSQKYVDSISTNGGYKDVCISGFTLKQVKFGSYLGVAASLLFPLAIPAAFALNQATRQLDYYYMVVDMQTGEQKMLIVNTINRWSKKRIVNLQVSYAIYQTISKTK